MINSFGVNTKTDEAGHLLMRLQKQLNKVEQLMNASMRPLMRQELLLSEQASRQALETLERWSELYRHGLEASGKISELGRDWLVEANERLGLTVEELRKLDNTNEAMATEERDKKAEYLLETIDNIKNLILPIADKVKISVVEKV